MKIKRLFALAVAVIIASVLMLNPLCALAAVEVNENGIDVLPGNTQSSNPVYSMAWLDNIVIRDGSTAVQTVRTVPLGDYPYSKTYDEFISEVEDYKKLNALNEETVTSGYMETVEMLFYLVTALDMTDDLDTMALYLSNNGINMPLNMTGDDKIKTAVVYAAMKYNAIYVLYGKNVEIVKGTTLDGAVVIILAELSATKLPSGIDTVTGFAVQVMKTYVEQFEEIPMSENPESDEVFYWIKVITAASNDYKVPLLDYGVTEEVYKVYVDYAYYASLFNTLYDIKLDPIKLAEADMSKDHTAVASLILKTMLDEKEVSYKDDSSCENLFALACISGCFNLEEEFYSDIFNYDLYVSTDCQKVWFTPFGLADELDGSNEYITVQIQERKISTSETTYAVLDPTKTNEQVVMVVTYDDGIMPPEKISYTFNVYKSNVSNKVDPNSSLVDQIQSTIDSAIPDGANEKVDAIGGYVISTIDEIGVPDFSSVNNENILSTYPDETTVENGYTGQAEKAEDGIDFNYLNSLIGNTYASEENTTYNINDYITEKEEKSALKNAAEKIKENPEIIAAPTSVVALGGVAGLMLGKRKKPSDKNDFDSEE
ncbi:MAG: hypothetical protein IJ262_03655 [Clostridia bacterium]|nr:hypothetical protein [Clostridia bacterium]